MDREGDNNPVQYVIAEDMRQVSKIACDAVRRGAVAVAIAVAPGGAVRVGIIWSGDAASTGTASSCSILVRSRS